jgi:Leucine-rich repeat (LRR) protein
MIEDISGISTCSQLKVLTLCGNQIKTIEPLKNLPLKTLEVVLIF